MSERFNGRWAIDLDRSKVWDDASQQYVRDEVGDEIITLHVEGGVQDYEVLYGDAPRVRMGYTSRYDDTQWVPYLVREVTVPDNEDAAESVSRFKQRIKAADGARERHFEVGKPYGWVRTAYVDELTHYRISRGDDGNAQSIMMRRMADDGRSYLAAVLDTLGIVFRLRYFVRVDDE